MLKGLFSNCGIWLASRYIVTGATCGAGNAHSFWNIWFYSHWRVHDLTQSVILLYIHYVYELMILVCLPGLVWLLCLELILLGIIRNWFRSMFKPWNQVPRYMNSWVGRSYYQTTIKKGWVSEFVQCLNQFGLIRILVNISCGLGQIMMITYDFLFYWLWEILQQIPIWPVKLNFWSIFLDWHFWMRHKMLL